MGNSFFHFQQFSIFSQEKGLKVNSDACLLGAIAEFQNPSNCLDIGTGTGVIALFLAQRFPNAAISAIEIEESIYLQALDNIEKSIFKQQISTLHGDVLTFKFDTKFDLIVCNPPYFKNHLEQADSEKNRAIHNKGLDPEQLIQKIESILSTDGLFWIVYPPHESEVFKTMCQHSDLSCVEEIQVYNKPDKHYRSICCYGLNKKSRTNHRILALTDSHGEKTEDFRLLMSGFYLENTEKYKRKSRASE